MDNLITRIKPKAHLIVVIVLAVFFMLFVLQNTAQVQISFLFWSISISRALMLLIAVFFGVAFGLISIMGHRAWKVSPALRVREDENSEFQQLLLRQKTQIDNLQSELLKTKNMLEAVEKNRINIADSLSDSNKRKSVAENDLSTTQTALSDAFNTLSSLKTEMSQLQDKVKIGKLVDVIIQHDLRNALTAFVSLPETILDDPNLTENQKNIVKIVRDNGTKMLETLNSSLTLYRMEEGTYTKEFSDVNLYNVLLAVIERIGGVFLNFKQKVLIEIMDAGDKERGAFMVYGDEFLLFNIFMNLISNASEASPPGKPIVIRLSRNDCCSVSIRNYGEVPESIRGTFFDKMVTSGKKYGTGLGTYSAMLMTKAQNGNIELDCSESEMTTIHVRLPKPESS